MSEVNLRPGWLERQFVSVDAEKKTWPAWMHRDYEGPPPSYLVGMDLEDDPEHSEPEIVKVLQAIQDSANIELMPSWLRRMS